RRGGGLDMARQAPFPSTGPSMMPLALAVLLALLAPAVVTAAPEGELTWAVHVSLAPGWFDPAETTGIITPFMFLYALHDALVKPMPGNPLAPSLAESWTVSPDGLGYEFVSLTPGVELILEANETYWRRTPSVREPSSSARQGISAWQGMSLPPAAVEVATGAVAQPAAPSSSTVPAPRSLAA